MTLHLLDANVVIRAHEDYYPVDRIPAFWSWLVDMGSSNVIKIPRLIFDEVMPPPGPLANWLKQVGVKEALVLGETPDTELVKRVLNHGYAQDLNDVEIQEIGKDPFLIAAALAGFDRCVVTREVSRPSKTRAQRKIPDVCNQFGVQWMTDFALYRALNFTIR
jgi:hypothetical protein